MRNVLIALAVSAALLAGCNKIQTEDAIPALDYANVEGSAEAHFTWMNIQFGVLADGHVNSEGERIATVCIDINGYVRCQTVNNEQDEEQSEEQAQEALE